MESYAAGEIESPLLEETIGANFERTVREHADREALVEIASGRRWTWAELDLCTQEAGKVVLTFTVFWREAALLLVLV